MKYTKEWFNGKVLVIRNPEHFETLKRDLEITTDIAVEFPSIVYEGLHKSIDISGISEKNLLKLKTDKEFNRRIIELL